MAFDPSGLDIGRLYTRPQLAAMWGYASHEAIARGVVTPAGGGFIILFVTREKQKSLTQYDDFISADHLYWEGEARHGTDLRIARAHERGEEIHLFYRDIHHTPFRYHGRILITRFIGRTDGPSKFVFRLVHDLSAADDISQASNLTEVPPTEREAIVQARIGQGRFREDLLEYWSGCAVTDVRRPDLLRASHIKPWRWCGNRDRLNPHNGLLLLPHYDLLFDKGYITFDDEGRLQSSPSIRTLSPEKLGIDLRARLRRVEPQHIPFLEFHQNEVFVTHVTSE